MLVGTPFSPLFLLHFGFYFNLPASTQQLVLAMSSAAVTSATAGVSAPTAAAEVPATSAASEVSTTSTPEMTTAASAAIRASATTRCAGTPTSVSSVVIARSGASTVAPIARARIAVSAVIWAAHDGLAHVELWTRRPVPVGPAAISSAGTVTALAVVPTTIPARRG